MAFNRMWNFVSGWSPFKAQNRLNMDKDPAVTILRQEYNAIIGSLKPEDSKKVEKLLRSTNDFLKLQFSPKQQYRGDAIHAIIDKHLQLLTEKETNVSAQTTKQTESTKPSSTATAQEISEKKPVTASTTTKTKTEENVSTNEEVAVRVSGQSTGQAKSQSAQKVEKTSSVASGKENTNATGLSEAEISNALDAFEFSLTGKVGDQPQADTKDVEVKEDELKPGKAVITGFRGNPYYEEELRKAVDSSMSGDGTDAKPASSPVGKPATDPHKTAGIPVKPATDSSKSGDSSSTKPSDSSSKDSKPSERRVCYKPPQPSASPSSNTDNTQSKPENSATGLTKEEINKSLDIFESSLSEEIPEFESNVASEDVEVMHVAKTQSTGSGKPAPAAEEKVVKASLTGGATSLSKDEITSALDAFEAGLGGNLDTNLIAANLVADVRDGKDKESKETVKEEVLKPDKALRTGGRGNPYYEEELRKAVDDSMANDAKPAAKPAAAADDVPKNPAGSALTAATATTAATTTDPSAKPAAAAPNIEPAATAAAASTAKPAALTATSHKDGGKENKSGTATQPNAAAAAAAEQPKTTDTHSKPGNEAKDSSVPGKESKPSGEPTDKKLKTEGDSSHGATNTTDKKPSTEEKTTTDKPVEPPKPSGNQ